MGQRIEAVDAYIEGAAEFARPILERLRGWVHEGCPEVTEAIKWSSPAFEHQGLLGVMAAFKAHVVFGFWKGKLLEAPEGLLEDKGFGGSGSLRLESLDDLPEKEVFLGLLRQAVDLNERGVALPKTPKKDLEPEVPEDLAAGLAESPEARKTFEGFAPGQRRDYVDWITSAKRQATRDKRLATTLEWLAEGKTRHWKYQNC